MPRTQVTATQILDRSLTGADLETSIGIFDETETYNIDDYVFWNATRWKCILAVTVPHNTGDFSASPEKDTTHWVNVGIDVNAHKTLDQLVHGIAENNYTEITRTSNRVTNVTIWTTSGKTIKIREFVITRDGNNKVQSVVMKQYNNSGVLVETYTQTITRTSGKVTAISGVMS